MTQEIVNVSVGILIFVREGRKLVSVRFVDAAIAHYYTKD
jgi:hypothetical protein